MTRRHAILVQLLEGPDGEAQEKAIRSLAPSGGLSARLRTILLRAADRPELDRLAPKGERLTPFCVGDPVRIKGEPRTRLAAAWRVSAVHVHDRSICYEIRDAGRTILDVVNVDGADLETRT